MTHWTYIQATDVWMFRDNKPFSAGQNFVARSIFPPTPQTMQGIIRTTYLDAQNVNWNAYNAGRERPELYDQVGDSTSLGQLRITGPFVARKTEAGIERLYPAPLDLVQSKADANSSPSYHIMAPQPLDFETTPPFEGWQPVRLANNVAGVSAIEDAWLTEVQFKAYLSGQSKAITGDVIKTSDLYQTEERPGLGIDGQRRAARESLFYRAQFVRPADDVGDDVGLLVGTNRPVLNGISVARMGGEGRSGRFESVSYTPPQSATSGAVKIVLLTPAYFDGGWGPLNNDWSPWVGSGRLVSYVAGKPQTISGWNLALRQPKPLRHFVPAGSVYYFTNATLSGLPFTQALHGEPDLGAMGFGAFASGNWSPVS